MAISVVQRASGFGSSGNIVVPFGSAVTAGNTLLAIAVRDAGTMPATLPTDTLTNTYVSLDTQNGSGIAYRAFAVHSASGGANSVTYPTGSFSVSVLIFEIAGLASTNFFDAASLISATLTSAGITTVDANELLLAIYFDNGNVLPTVGLGAGYSNLTGPVNNTFAYIASEERIVASTGTYTAAFTSSGGNGNTYVILLAFGDTAITHAPTVTTQAESSISDVSATANGNITSLGGAASADTHGIVYSTSTQSLPGNVAPASSGYSGLANTTGGSFGTGAFTDSMTGLSPGITYFARAYAHNSAGYGYGNEISFTTLTGLPTVTTQAATGMTEHTVTGNGNQTVLGTSTTTEEGIVYDVASQSLPGNVAPASSGYAGTAHSTGSFGTGAFTQGASSLTKNTTYFMRAYARNTTGYAYGNEVSFTTLPGFPLIDRFSDVDTGFTDDISGKADDFLLLEDGVSKLLLENGTDRLVINYDYPSGNYVSYLLDTPDQLMASTVYYWRVRKRLSNGAFGPWSVTRSFTTGGGVPNFTRTHTTDSLLHTKQTRTHTTDGLKRKTVLLTHTTDGLKRKTTLLTHTTDGLKRKTTLKTHTTDGNKRKTTLLTHTTDGLKRKTTLLTHTTDGLKRTTTLKTHTTDALRRAQNIRTFTTDGLKRKTTLRTHTTDANKRLVTLKTHTTDANKTHRSFLTHTTDAYKRLSPLRSHTTDGLKRKTTTLSHSTDTTTHRTLTRVHTTDALIRKTNLRTHSTDGLKRKVTLRTHTTDGLKRTIVLKAHTTDALLRKVFLKVHSTDALLRRQVKLTHTTDANKRKVTTRTHSTDANKRLVTLRSHTTDGYKRISVQLHHSTDGLKRKTTLRTHTSDALLRKTFTRSHSTDALLLKGGHLAHTTDALKRTRTVLTHKTDAFILRRVLKTHTTDGLLKKTFSRFHSTDAAIKIIFSRHHSTDGLKHTKVLKFHTTDAYRVRRFTRSHSTDAYIKPYDIRVKPRVKSAYDPRSSIKPRVQTAGRIARTGLQP